MPFDIIHLGLPAILAQASVAGRPVVGYIFLPTLDHPKIVPDDQFVSDDSASDIASDRYKNVSDDSAYDIFQIVLQPDRFTETTGYSMVPPAY